MTEKKKEKKSSKDWLDFIVPIKLTTTTEWGERGKKRKRKSKRIYRTSQNIRIINVFPESLLSESFPSWDHSPPHLPRMPSDTVLNSGPAVGAAQILICSYSSVFLPPMSAAIRTSVFSFVRVLNDLLHIPQTESLPRWSFGFNLQLVQLVGRFWVFFLSHTVPSVILFPPLDIGHPLRGSSWGCPGGLGFAPVRARCRGGAAAWVTKVLAAPGTQGSWRPGQQEI